MTGNYFQRETHFWFFFFFFFWSLVCSKFIYLTLSYLFLMREKSVRRKTLCVNLRFLRVFNGFRLCWVFNLDEAWTYLYRVSTELCDDLSIIDNKIINGLDPKISEAVRPVMFCKTGVFKNLTKFTGKQPYHSLYFW